MEQIKDMRQIVVNENERRQLHQEFERMLIQADQETNGSMYSGELIKNQHPMVHELYRLAFL